MSQNSRQPLKPGYLIEGYRIDKLIGGGGFSLVYRAYQVRNKRKVVIKEYFPGDMVERMPGGRVLPKNDDVIRAFNMGIKRFFDEAGALSKIRHPHIVHVTNFFRDNDTAYMVMDYYEKGRDLRWYIKRSPEQINNHFLWSVFPRITLGLAALHDAGFLHLDIKPANILIREGGKPLLIDFGAVQRVEKGQRFRGIQTLTHGFASPEQYQRGEMGPWSDLYALGATMYSCVTSQPPPSAMERLDKDQVRQISKQYRRKFVSSLLTAIEWAMQLDYHHRPADAHSFLNALLEDAPEQFVASVEQARHLSEAS
jgi:serine/threonine protein kinase